MKKRLSIFEGILQLVLLVVVLPLLVYWTIHRSKSNYGVCYTIELDSVAVNEESANLVFIDTLQVMEDSCLFDSLITTKPTPRQVIHPVWKEVLDSVLIVDTLSPLPIIDSNHQIIDTLINHPGLVTDTTPVVIPLAPKAQRFLFFK